MYTVKADSQYNAVVHIALRNNATYLSEHMRASCNACKIMYVTHG